MFKPKRITYDDFDLGIFNDVNYKLFYMVALSPLTLKNVLKNKRILDSTTVV